MKRIAIILAREKSKRIPLKNIKKFLGIPVIAYPIKAALETKIFDEVIVSTDSETIANLARELGASVPFLRSEKNSGDFASTADVLLEVLERVSADYFCCLYACSPFVTSNQLVTSFEMLEKTPDADGIFPVCEFSFPIQRSLKIGDTYMSPMSLDSYFMRSQDLTKHYHDVGQFYWARTNSFLKEKVLLTAKTLPYVVPESSVQDIDTFEDWKIAEIKYQILNGK